MIEKSEFGSRCIKGLSPKAMFQLAGIDSSNGPVTGNQLKLFDEIDHGHMTMTESGKRYLNMKEMRSLGRSQCSESRKPIKRGKVKEVSMKALEQQAELKILKQSSGRSTGRHCC